MSLCAFSETYFGVPLTEDRLPIVTEKLQMFAVNEGFTGLHDLMEYYKKNSLVDNAIRNNIVHLLTAHETSFFRFPSVYEYIKSVFHDKDKFETLHYLSAGSSIGGLIRFAACVPFRDSEHRTRRARNSCCHLARMGVINRFVTIDHVVQ